MDNVKHIFSVTALALFLAAGVYLLVSPEEPSADDVASTDAEEALASEAFFVSDDSDSINTGEESLSVIVIGDSTVADPLSYAVFSASDTELTLCWEDAVLPQDIETNILSTIDLFSEEGYRVSFLLYDLENGQGICYHSTDSYYSASAIKGPYVACIAETFPDSLEEGKEVFSDIIQVSDNDAYSCLWDIYGPEVFETWVSEAGCENIDVSGLYTDITARNMALMWVRIYDYFTSDSTDSEWISSLYMNTINSCIAEALGGTYTVYSKAGWICEDDYYNVQNDAGIVMSDSPYVFVVLSDAYERMDLLDQLVISVDNAHTCLVENTQP